MRPNPEPLFNRLNKDDHGGRYDSRVGSNQGHPPGSICVGYKHFVQVR